MLKRIIMLQFLAVIHITSAGFGETLTDTLKGVILDVTNDSPISGVIIKITDSPHYAVSDKAGYFYIYLSSVQNPEIEFSHIAYKSLKIKVKDNNRKASNLIIHLTPSTYSTETIVVSGRHMKTGSHSDDVFTDILQGKELEKALGTTLAFTLKNEAGVSMRSMGPAPSRPVIRGMGGDRVLILEDGFPSVDLSATSPDHAVSLDPFTIERVEVIRGPAVLVHSPITIGGIVNVIRNEINRDFSNSIEGMAGIYGESANKGLLGSGILQVPVDDFLFRYEFSRRTTENLQTPIRALPNSNSTLINQSGSFSYRFGTGYTGMSVRNFSLNYGIPGGFVGAHPDGVRINLFKRAYTAKLYMDLHYDYISSIDFRVSRNYFSQQEFESTGLVGAEFGIFHYSGQLEISTKNLGIFKTGTMGLNAEYRDFNIGGFVFTSPSKSVNISGFIYQNVALSNQSSLETGIRLGTASFRPQNTGQLINGKSVESRNFFALSFSVSYSHMLNDNNSLGAALHKTSRFPTIEELYSAGPHLAAYSYETGNPELKEENGYGIEVFHAFSTELITLKSNIYFNYLNSYILPRNNGKINFATLLPTYETSGVQARLAGGEIAFEFMPAENITITNTLSYTYGEFLTKAGLPSIPPFKNHISIGYKSNHFSMGIRSEFAATQNRVDSFEIPTPGYGVHGAFIQYTFLQKSIIHNLSLNVDNIFNKEYRNHLSRVKVILPESGISARFIYKLYF